MMKVKMASGEIYDRALEVVIQNRQRRLDGGVNSLPFSSGKLMQVIPGLQQKNMTIISAATGVGKSKFTKQFYVLEPFEFVKAHPEAGIKLDIFYFALEESAENFMHSMMVRKLFTDYAVRVPIKKLKAIASGEVVGVEIVEHVREMRPWFEEFERHVHVISHITNPTGIYKYVEDFLLANGHWVMKEKTFNFPDGPKTIQVKDHYVPDNPQHYIEVILDHLGLVSNESGLNHHQTMSRMSSDYGIALRDKYGCAVTFVQQQAFEVEAKQYTYKGALIEEKLEPSLQTLGDNKLVSRDADEVIALFAPERYDLTNHRGYDILKLQDNYRSVKILKSRDGEANVRIGMFFDGAVNHFEELPKASAMEADDYEYYANKAGRTLSPSGGQQILNFS